MRERFRVNSIHFSLANRSNLVEGLEEFFLDKPSCNYVCVSNVHCAVMASVDPLFKSIQNSSFLTIADGQPIIIYGKISGVKGIERIMGPDIMSLVFSHDTASRRRHFFFGGTPETLSKMLSNLAMKFPSLNIAGSFSPPFRMMQPSEIEEAYAFIESKQPDYIWVCLGAPKQEYWIGENHRRFPNALLIGIGAGFQYHSGELKRAPAWAQKLALEWVWRLLQDPKRLFRRYVSTNPIFLLWLVKLLAMRSFSALGKVLRR